MKRRWLRWSWCALAGILCLALATAASAGVVVTVQGDTAYATISLTGSNGITYDADVTIVFDHPEHLTAHNLNLQAQLVDPVAYGANLPSGVTIDPNFPVLLTVVPPHSAPSVSKTAAPSSLVFENTYQIDVHTHDLLYAELSPYRLFKAPVGQRFDDDNADVTNDVLPGSVRVRGRGGDFSQFLVVNDARDTLGVAVGKILALHVRVLSAILSDGLRLQLLQLIVKLDTLILIDLVGALDVVGEIIDLINANAGTNIANVWSASGGPANDAGDLNQIAYTLQFSINRLLQGGSANP
jgi:hypothetical protein